MEKKTKRIAEENTETLLQDLGCDIHNIINTALKMQSKRIFEDIEKEIREVRKTKPGAGILSAIIITTKQRWI